MNVQSLTFVVPTYYTVLGFLMGKTPDRILRENVVYWLENIPKELYLQLISEAGLPDAKD